MDEQAVRELAVNAFKREYPSDTEVKGGEVVLSAFGGNLAVIISKEDGRRTEEICFIGNDQKVKFFQSANELAGFLERNVRRTWLEKLLAKEGISAIVTLAVLVTLCILAFRPENVNQQAITFLGAAFAAAVGFLFGSTGQRGF